MRLVSVLINNFNYGKYLEYCIRSVLQQTYRNIEIIVYDDCSSDNSIKIVEQYEGRVRLIRGKSRHAIASQNQMRAINVGFEQSKGDIVCLLDSDDAFKASKVESIVNKMLADPKIVMVQDKFALIDARNVVLGKSRKPVMINVDPIDVITKLRTLEFLFVQTSGLSFRRDFLEAVLPFEPDNFDKLWMDVRLTRKAVFYGKIITLDEYLTEYRVHDRNDSSKLSNNQYLFDCLKQLYSYFNELPENKIRHRLLPGISIHQRVISKIKVLMYYLFMSHNSLSEKLSFAGLICARQNKTFSNAN